MISFINSVNTNCCNGGTAMIKNKSQKELSFDIKTKSFQILSIKHIRKNYQKHKLAERSMQESKFIDKQGIEFGQGQLIQRQSNEITKVSSYNKRKSLLSVYCQKISKITQQQSSKNFNQKPEECQKHSQNNSFKSFQYIQTQIKRPKIHITCGNNNKNNLMNGHSQGYLKIDGIKRLSNIKQVGPSIQVQQIDKDKRLTMQVEPNQRRYSLAPQYIIPKPVLSRQSQKDKFSQCTTIDNSQNYSLVNNLPYYPNKTSSKVQKSQYVCSKITQIEQSQLQSQKVYGSIERLGDKENNINLGNKRPKSKDQLKTKKYHIHDEIPNTKQHKISESKQHKTTQSRQHKITESRQRKISESILFQQNQLQQPYANLSKFSQHHQSQETISKIRLQINTLHKQFKELKLEQQFLLNKLNHNHHYFQARYQLLLEKKTQCEIQEQKRSQEIHQIKQLLYQRAHQINSNQFTNFNQFTP